MSVILEHCKVTGPLGSHVTAAELSGDAFDISLRQFQQGEGCEGTPEELGEEVATILSGEFDIDAAGEHYRLTPGEGILIPDGEPRRWSCVSPQGVLYRAVLRVSRHREGGI